MEVFLVRVAVASAMILLELSGGSVVSQPESLALQMFCDLMACKKFLFCLS